MQRNIFNLIRKEFLGLFFFYFDCRKNKLFIILSLIFRRQIPIKDMLLWSHHPLKTPMIRIHNASHAKVCFCFFCQIC
jgi:hypothetical protein